MSNGGPEAHLMPSYMFLHERTEPPLSMKSYVV